MKLADYAALAVGLPCYGCGSPLSDKIETANHKEGWLVEEFAVRQWLWVNCTHCSTQVALWKIGIPGCLSIGPNESARKDAHNKQLARFMELRFQPAGVESEKMVVIPNMSSRDSRTIDDRFRGGWRLLGWLNDHLGRLNFAVVCPPRT